MKRNMDHFRRSSWSPQAKDVYSVCISSSLLFYSSLFSIPSLLEFFLYSSEGIKNWLVHTSTDLVLLWLPVWLRPSYHLLLFWCCSPWGRAQVHITSRVCHSFSHHHLLQALPPPIFPFPSLPPSLSPFLCLLSLWRLTLTPQQSLISRKVPLRTLHGQDVIWSHFLSFDIFITNKTKQNKTKQNKTKHNIT